MILYPSVQYAPANSTVFFPFATYNISTGASITITGLAVTDIEVYQLPSMTQRSSDAGYTLLDTDGIDLDGITGIHGISIDLSDNSEASFYSVGAWYTVIVSSITLNAQTVSFPVGMFRLMEADGSGIPAVNVTQVNGSNIPTPSVAGVLPVDVKYFGGVAGTFTAGRAEVNATHIVGASISAASGVLAVNVIQISDDASAAAALEAVLDGTGGGTLAADLSGTVTGVVGMDIDDDGAINANVIKVNHLTITGSGTDTDPWGPV